MTAFGIFNTKKRDHLPGCLISASRCEIVEVVDRKVAVVVVDGVVASTWRWGALFLWRDRKLPAKGCSSSTEQAAVSLLLKQ